MADEDEANEYERLRQENILKNKALLKQLQLDPASLGKTKTAASSSKSPASKSKRKKKRVPEGESETPLPRRTSSRLAGLPADSERAKRKADEDDAALQAAESASRAKRARVPGDLSFELKRGLLDATKGVRSFTEEDVEETTDKSLKGLRESMMGLKMYEKFEMNDIKICPERIYHLAFHPVVDKQLIFAGDKVGNLGVFDAQSHKEDEDGGELPDISHFKVHARAISTFTFDPVSPTSIFTASYDGSVRKFDLATGIASEVFVGDEHDGLSGVEVPYPNLVYFSTLDGRLGRRDLRVRRTEVWALSEKKIGGFSLHPRVPHLAATGSLDRTVKIWDLRNIKGTGEDRSPDLLAEHKSQLSVSCALWNSNGTLATTSYDDTVKLYKFPDAMNWGAGDTVEQLEPTHTIRHNNQTGRWVTILRAQWQQTPPGGGPHKFVIANMKRFLDIYTENGDQLAQLGGESISAVPAVAQFHPTQDWVAGGTGSGKLALFM